MSEIFKKAKLSPSSKAAKTATKEKKKTLETVVCDGLLTFVGCTKAEGLIKDLRADIEGPIKAKITERFISDGLKAKAIPENFKVIETVSNDKGEVVTEANATATLVTKSASSELTEDEIAILKKHDVPFLTVDTVDDTLIINPVYASDQAMLAKVAEALALIDDLPKDFIFKQRIKKKTIDPENTLAKLFTKTEDAIREVLPVVSTVAFRSQKLKDKTHSVALSIVNEVVRIQVEKEKQEAE